MAIPEIEGNSLSEIVIVPAYAQHWGGMKVWHTCPQSKWGKPGLPWHACGWLGTGTCPRAVSPRWPPPLPPPRPPRLVVAHRLYSHLLTLKHLILNSMCSLLQLSLFFSKFCTFIQCLSFIEKENVHLIKTTTVCYFLDFLITSSKAKAQVAANKNEHNFRHLFLSQLFLLFDM